MTISTNSEQVLNFFIFIFWSIMLSPCIAQPVERASEIKSYGNTVIEYTWYVFILGHLLSELKSPYNSIYIYVTFTDLIMQLINGMFCLQTSLLTLLAKKISKSNFLNSAV